MKKMIYAFAAIVMLGSILLVACKKETSSGSQQQLSVYLTDGPVAFDSVFIDIASIEAKIDTSTATMHDDHHGDNDFDRDDSLRRSDEFGTWQTLNITPGIYNVLSLRNGIDALVASGSITGVVRKIRITLGTNNTVVKNGVTYPLNLLNSTGKYLYIQLHDQHRDHHNNSAVAVWIDFDLGRSIVERNGQYYLIPVLRPFCDRNFATLSGKVLPKDAKAVVKVYSGTDTAVAIPNPDGYFKVRGLNAGTYSVLFDGIDPYKDTTINNVTLTIDKEVHLSDVILKQ